MFRLPRWSGDLPASCFPCWVGTISGLLGIGGGLVLVPVMVVLMGVPIKTATATSTFMIGMTGVASAAIQLTRGMIRFRCSRPR